MQQVLKSRAILQQHNDASALRGNMDCGECNTRQIIEPMDSTRKWLGMDHEPLDQTDLKAVKRFAKACAVVFVVAQVVFLAIELWAK